MRHRRDHRKLSRTASHRKALLRNLVTALFLHERIETTRGQGQGGATAGRAADHLRQAEQPPLAPARARAWSRTEDVVQKLFDTIAPCTPPATAATRGSCGRGAAWATPGEMAILELVKTKRAEGRRAQAQGRGGEAAKPKKSGFLGRKKKEAGAGRGDRRPRP